MGNYRVKCLSMILAHFPSFIAALEELEQLLTDDARTKCSGFRNMLSFNKIFQLFQHILSYTEGLSLALQKTSCNLMKVYKSAQGVITKLSELRTEDKFDELYLKGIDTSIRI